MHFYIEQIDEIYILCFNLISSAYYLVYYATLIQSIGFFHSVFHKIIFEITDFRKNEKENKMNLNKDEIENYGINS